MDDALTNSRGKIGPPYKEIKMSECKDNCWCKRFVVTSDNYTHFYDALSPLREQIEHLYDGVEKCFERIEQLEIHHARQIDENRKISARVDMILSLLGIENEDNERVKKKIG